jgi:hypothetical protein
MDNQLDEAKKRINRGMKPREASTNPTANAPAKEKKRKGKEKREQEQTARITYYLLLTTVTTCYYSLLNTQYSILTN